MQGIYAVAAELAGAGKNCAVSVPDGLWGSEAQTLAKRLCKRFCQQMLLFFVYRLKVEE